MSIQELPISIELIEFPAVELQAEDQIHQPEVEQPVEVGADVESESEASPSSIEPPALSWRQKIALWLASPWHVKWSDIKGRGRSDDERK